MRTKIGGESQSRRLAKVAERTRLRIRGPVRLGNAHEVARQTMAGIQGGAKEVVVDLIAVESADSSAVAMLLLLLRQARKNKVKLDFEGFPESLRSLLHLYRLEDLFPSPEQNP